MSTRNYYEGIKHVVHIHTNYPTNCEHCSASFEANRFAESMNHYVEQHGYKLLHVGSETANFEGNHWYFSVATLGK